MMSAQSPALKTLCYLPSYSASSLLWKKVSTRSLIRKVCKLLSKKNLDQESRYCKKNLERAQEGLQNISWSFVK